MYVLCHNRMLKEAGHLPNGDSTAKLKKKKAKLSQHTQFLNKAKTKRQIKYVCL